jgi:hypothetical protein
VLVKRIACEVPQRRDQPLARYSLADVVRRVAADPALRPMGRTTVWRILAHDAIKPWRQRCWLFPRGDDFVARARVIVELYAGWWEGQPLGSADYVLCADEKTSIQARVRLQATQPPQAGQALRYEHEYARGGALQYLAVWDVRRALAIGRCDAKTGIEPFHQLVDLVMQREPYCSARRVFWIVDNGSSHRGQAFAQRLSGWYPNTIAVPLPVHASWLNQIEIYFSIVQRKVLTPNDFTDLLAVERRLLAFETYYGQVAQPFDWKFTADDLQRWWDRLHGWEHLTLTA